MIPGLRDTIGAYLLTVQLTPEEEECFWQAFLRIEGDMTPIALPKSLAPISLQECQQRLAHLNERTARRKKDGVYYTDEDLTEYMVFNAFNCFVSDDVDNVSDVTSLRNKFSGSTSATIERLLRASTFDPTCGAGEFLVSAVKFKCELLFASKNLFSDKDLAKLLSTVYGNDIERSSVVITQIRLILELFSKLKDKKNIHLLERALHGHFTVEDYVTNIRKRHLRYDIMLGNPPYVEYTKLPAIPKGNFGNSYADVLNNVTHELKSAGAIAFVVPLSYVSTPRMNSIRQIFITEFKKQFVLSFADRPDCLFVSAHQKLCIVFASRKSTKETCGFYTSTYHYWYKSERNSLFDSLSVQKNEFVSQIGVPKIGNNIELQLHQKTHIGGRDLLSCLSSRGDTVPLYLNMRGCFWMKAFSAPPTSSEYKMFSVRKDEYGYIMCILNSSLYFSQWIALSDCWHITRKELDTFSVPEITRQQKEMFGELAIHLENKLEDTKVYIGSKQVDYEYKHKLCKDVIDEIDTALKPVYNLNDEEVKYVKSFKLKYRLSNDEQ